MKQLSHWIGGAAVDGTSGRTSPVFNPATGTHTADVPLATVEEVGRVVATAADAFPAWAAPTRWPRPPRGVSAPPFVNAPPGTARC